VDDEILLQRLSEEIRNISSTLDQATANGHVMNEAQTEYLVIDPLLRVLGYSQIEVYKRGRDNVVNNYPDYTLLLGKPQQWFLEAKKLDHHLQDGEAAQAVNYANNQGAEWAVLTNGRKWFLYNAHLPKPLADKRVFVIDDLFDTDHSLPILKLLTKDAMLRGSLTEAWKRHQVTTFIKHQIETPQSPVRRLLRKLASEEIKNPVDDALIGQLLSSCPRSSTHLANATGQGILSLVG
jgi:predicted type IV restriction endonuclease